MQAATLAAAEAARPTLDLTSPRRSSDSRPAPEDAKAEAESVFAKLKELKTSQPEDEPAEDEQAKDEPTADEPTEDERAEDKPNA